MDDHSSEELARPGPDPSVYPFLSLYLLLLAFFILLNVISDPNKDRLALAVDSVNRAFFDRVQRTDDFIHIAADVDSPIAADEYLEEVKDIFALHLVEASYKSGRFGTLLRIKAPADRLFEPGTDVFRTEAEALLEALAASLRRHGRGRRRGVEFVVGAGPRLPRAPKLGEVIEIRRAGAIARDLRGRGVPAIMISSGIQAGDPGTVMFTFHSFRDEGARVTFEGLAE